VSERMEAEEMMEEMVKEGTGAKRMVAKKMKTEGMMQRMSFQWFLEGFEWFPLGFQWFPLGFHWFSLCFH
jgi:hypothetical protein